MWSLGDVGVPMNSPPDLTATEPEQGGAAAKLPRVLIDGEGTVWVRDWQDGVDLYRDESHYVEPSEPLTYAEIERRWGISTWLMSSKSVPS